MNSTGNTKTGDLSTLAATKAVKPIGLRASVNAMCKSCIYDPYPGSGNWRQQVTACTAKDCPLYLVRPISKPRDKESRDD